jgi:hypothetical protein
LDNIMPLNFGILQPVDIGARFMAGREEAQRNQLAQQQRAQDQELNALRMQQTRGAISQQERQLKAETATQKTAMFRDRMQRAPNPNAVRELVKMQHADPDLGPILSQTGTLEQALAEVPDDPVQFERYRQQEVMGMSEWMKSQQPKVVGGSIYKPATDTFITPPKETTTQESLLMQQLGYPLTPQGYQDFINAKKPSTLRSSEEEAQAIRIARASRPPAQPAAPVAPTITQIVDPTNPNQMITIDAKRYQGGGAGTPGVIGVAGKEPSAALRVNKVEQGKTQLADDLENLRASFETLNNLRAVPSTERGPLSNVASAVASSRVGQLTGQAFATEAQVERDVINSARSRLVNSIKNATGMSAQQLNSNVELQTMLKSISDPGQSYQSAIRIIQDIEDAYVKGDGMLPKKNKPSAAPAATQGTGGFRYLGKESN